MFATCECGHPVSTHVFGECTADGCDCDQTERMLRDAPSSSSSAEPPPAEPGTPGNPYKIERVYLPSALRRGRMQTRPHYVAAGLMFSRRKDAAAVLVNIAATGTPCDAPEHEQRIESGWWCWKCKGTRAPATKAAQS